MVGVGSPGDISSTARFFSAPPPLFSQSAQPHGLPTPSGIRHTVTLGTRQKKVTPGSCRHGHFFSRIRSRSASSVSHS